MYRSILNAIHHYKMHFIRPYLLNYPFNDASSLPGFRHILDTIYPVVSVTSRIVIVVFQFPSVVTLKNIHKAKRKI